MNEYTKLKEAQYFNSEMVKKQLNRDSFNYNLSAFLSSARSILQYALEEAKLGMSTFSYSYVLVALFVFILFALPW